MSQPVLTYAKREIRKVLPVFIIPLLLILAAYLLIYYRLHDNIDSVLLFFSSPADYNGNTTGDVFFEEIQNVMGHFWVMFVWALEILLVQRLFYLENRAEISDFMRILPIRESKKMYIKVLTGEGVLFLLSLSFGAAGSFVYRTFEAAMIERDTLLIHALTGTNIYAVLWRMTLLFFLELSAIFLVLFVAQCIIHNRAVAFGIGIGVLYVPGYFSQIISLLYGVPYKFYKVPEVLYEIKQNLRYDGIYDMMGQEIQRITVFEPGFRESVMFLFSICLLAVTVLFVLLKFRWQIRSSANQIINSKVVTQFIVSGFSVCVGCGVAMAFQHRHVLLAEMGNAALTRFLVITFSSAVFVFALINIWFYIQGKRQRGQ